jgi:hypothetical protein
MDNPAFGNCIYIREGCEYKPFYSFEPNFEEFDNEGNFKDLFGCYTVATFALDFAAKKGYKKAILYGILDGNYTESKPDHLYFSHFYDEILHEFHKENLKSWKKEIFGYANKYYKRKPIEIEIPYLNI